MPSLHSPWSVSPQTGVYALIWEKYQTEVTELKNTTELKNKVGFKNRLDEADKRISDLKTWQ